MPQPDGPDERAPDTNAKPFVERRRPGRVEYTNPHVIALLRGESVREDVGTELDRGAADSARSPGAPGWPIVLLALAIASWGLVGVLAWLAWLVIRLL